jgi:hypothetical protein
MMLLQEQSTVFKAMFAFPYFPQWFIYSQPFLDIINMFNFVSSRKSSRKWQQMETLQGLRLVAEIIFRCCQTLKQKCLIIIHFT